MVGAKVIGLRIHAITAEILEHVTDPAPSVTPLALPNPLFFNQGDSAARCLRCAGLVPIDRVAADLPFYSGKHRRHGMNLQVIATPGGDIVWVSGPLPGAVHDRTATRIWGIVHELAA